MSTTVDERIVSMQFDNKHFESNVQTSMSTLQKLKQALRLDGAAKGLSTVQSAASKITLAPLGSAVEGVKVKFDAMGVVAATTLANITNQAVNAGKRIASSLTIDPIKSGFSEYELKMNSMQTIVSSTGESIETVNKYLNELNEYSDKTIYSFSDMTQNIGKFTNAGVKLEDAVAAIQGISNEAALSGANANEASRAMYNFAQALSAGHVKLIDWKSIENANMATVGFKEELIKTALELETLTDAGDGMYQTLEGNTLSATKNFNETLQDQWMTSEVLIKTLKKYSSENTDVGKAAFEAATKVRTFSQMMDTLKESAQSGWATTWELIFGNLEEAKSLWTSVSDVVGGFIQKINNARNAVLEIALGVTKPFSGLADKISKVTGATDAMSKSTEELGDIVNRVIRGELGHGQERWDKLTEMGYDWAQVQNLVNEKLGSSVRHTSKLTDAQKDANKVQAENIEQLLKKTDAQLLELGFTKEEVAALRDLEKQSKKTGIPVDELIKDMDKLNGRTLLINSFKNIGQSLAKVFRSIADAWKEIFPPKSTEEKAQSLYNLIAGFHKLTSSFIMNDATADKLKRTFQGLFALIDIITTLTGGVFKIVLKTICKLLGMVDVDILSVTAKIGDAIVKVRDWIDEHNILAKAIQKMLPYLKMVAKAFAGWFDKLKESGVFDKIASAVKKVASAFKDWLVSLKESGVFSRALSYIKDLAIALKDWIVSLKDTKVFKALVSWVKKMSSAFKDWIAGMKEADNIPKYIIQGLVNGLKAGVSAVVQAIKTLITKLIDKARELLGIHSPSREFFSIGEYIIEGLINGLKSGISAIMGVVKHLVESITGAFDSVNWGAVMAVGISAGLIALVAKILGIVSNISKGMGGFGELMESTAGVLKRSEKNIAKTIKSFSKVLNSLAFSINANAIKSLAIAIAILVGAVIALTFFDPLDLFKAVVVITALAGVLSLLAWITSKMSDASASIGKDGINLKTGITGILSIGLAILAMAWAIKIVGDMTLSDAEQGFNALIGIVILLGAFVAVYGKVVKGKAAQNMDKAGKMMRQMAITMLLMIAVIKLCGYLNEDDVIPALAFAGSFLVFTALLATIGMIPSKQFTKLGSTMTKIAMAMMLMIGVIKLCGKLTEDDIWPAIGFAAGFLIFVKLLCDITSTANQDLGKIGLGLMGVAVAMGIMAGVVKLCGTMSAEEITKGLVCVTVFTLLVIALIAVLALAGKDTANVAVSMLGIAAAIGIMAGVTILLGLVEEDALKQGIKYVAYLAVMMAGLIFVTKFAKDCEKTVLKIGIVIGILAATLIALSFIKPEKLIMPTLAMMALMGMFAIIVKSTEYARVSMKTLLALAGVVVILGAVLAALSMLPLKNTLSNAVALSILMYAMVGVLKLINSMTTNLRSGLEACAILGILAATLFVFVGALALMSNVQNATSNAIALGALMLAMAIAVAVLSKVAPMMSGALSAIGQILMLAGAMVLMGIALNALVPVISTLGSMDFLVVAQGLITMAAALAIIGVAANLMKSFVDEMILLAVGIAAFGLALSLLVPSLQMLGSMGVGTIITALLALAGALAIIGVAALAMSTLVTPILAIAAAFALFGVGALAAGAGISLLASALVYLGANANTALLGLQTIILGMVALIPSIVAVIGVAILSILQLIVTVAPQIATTIATVILTILTTIATYLPAIIEAGMSIIMSILTGIRDNIGKITTVAIEIIVNFINAVASKLGDIIEAAVNLMLSFIEGLTSSLQKNRTRIENAIRNLFETIIDIAISIIVGAVSGIFNAAVKLIGGLLKGIGSCLGKVGKAVWDLVKAGAKKISDGYKAFKEAAGDMISGLVKGIGDGITKACNAVKDLAEKAKDKFCDIFDINSPSRVMFQYGKYIDEGLANGLKKYTTKVVRASSNVGTESLDTMRGIFSQISDAVNTDVDSQPTIRPVLDLSDIRSGAGAIGSMFNMAPSVGVAANIGSISSMMSRRQNGTTNDVVSAINDLKGALSNASGDSYTINGITYSEGSDVADAIKTLTRAAKVGRRV